MHHYMNRMLSWKQCIVCPRPTSVLSSSLWCCSILQLASGGPGFPGMNRMLSWKQCIVCQRPTSVLSSSLAFSVVLQYSLWWSRLPLPPWLPLLPGFLFLSLATGDRLLCWVIEKLCKRRHFLSALAEILRHHSTWA